MKKNTYISGIRQQAARSTRINDPALRWRETRTEEAAALLNTTVSTLRTMTWAKKVPAYKYMRNVIYFENELIRFKVWDLL